MKKTLLSSFIIVSFIFYTIIQKKSAAKSVNGVGSNSLNGSLNSNLNSTSNPSSTVTYKDGTYTGDSVDAYYGNVQVKAIITNGQVTNVQFLDYPKDRHTSIEINSQAMPVLSSEAIKNQNANVDIVSGATATSQAFIQSLQSALSQAQT